MEEAEQKRRSIRRKEKCNERERANKGITEEEKYEEST
jgi:hypothetical protein